MGNKKNKRSLRQRLQDAMSTPNGQIVMNYAYNWGASVVIMGTLFKLTHLPGANFMLFAGMGTEVIIFFLSAFDMSGVRRKSDEQQSSGGTTILGGIPAGMTPVTNLSDLNLQGQTVHADHDANASDEAEEGTPVHTGGPSIVVIGGGSPVQPAAYQPAPNFQPQQPQQPMQPMQQPVQPVQPQQPVQQPIQQPMQQPVQQPMQQPMQQPVYQQPVQQPQPIPAVSPAINEEMEEATAAYLEQLKSMTEMLSRCTAKANSFTDDTDQLANLGKTLSGINALYEMQLRTVSTQIGTIDQVHEQTRKMASQIEEMNEVYARMLQAMTSGK